VFCPTGFLCFVLQNYFVLSYRIILFVLSYRIIIFVFFFIGGDLFRRISERMGKGERRKGGLRDTQYIYLKISI
jgi:hypothetical protein